MKAGLIWNVTTSLPADRIQQARDLIADYLTILQGPSPLREIIDAVVNELEDARHWRIANMAAEDAAIRARQAELSHGEDVVAAIEVVRALVAYAGPRWRLSFPETYARVGSLVWTDILTGDALGDRVALARALERHYPTPACNRGAVTVDADPGEVTARSNPTEVTA